MWQNSYPGSMSSLRSETAVRAGSEKRSSSCLHQSSWSIFWSWSCSAFQILTAPGRICRQLRMKRRSQANKIQGEPHLCNLPFSVLNSTLSCTGKQSEIKQKDLFTLWNKKILIDSTKWLFFASPYKQSACGCPNHARDLRKRNRCRWADLHSGWSGVFGSSWKKMAYSDQKAGQTNFLLSACRILFSFLPALAILLWNTDNPYRDGDFFQDHQEYFFTA